MSWEIIDRNRQFWERKIKTQLRNFYLEKILPQFIDVTYLRN